MSAKQLDIAAGVSVPAWLISLAAETLPLIQWLAGLFAIIVSGLAIYRHFKRPK
jgi:hypothetical protein